MKKKKVLILETTGCVSFDIPKSDERNIMGAIMKHHIGREFVPLDEDFDFPQELKDAHHAVKATHMKKVQFRIYSDGSFECKVLK